MKKTLLLATMASLSLLQANAQQSSNPLFRNRPTHRNAAITQRLLQLQPASNTAQKPTGLKQRVIAQAQNPLIGSDSTRFTYTGTNGSAYDFNNSQYNYTDYYTSEYAPMFSVPYNALSTRILSDSIMKYDENGQYSKTKAYYRPDKKIDSTWSYYNNGAAFINAKVINVYNPQGYLTATYSKQQNTPPSWDTFSYQHFSYNSTFTRMDRDSIWVGSPSPSLRESNVYYYGASGKLDSFITWNLEGSSPLRSRSTLITYTGTGKLETVKSYFLEDGPASLYSLDSLGYTGGVDYFTYHEANEYENDTLYDGTREVKFVTAGLVDSVKGFTREGESNPWNYDGLIKYTYNSYSNPEKLTASITGLPQSLDIYKFYYETYDDNPSSISPIAENKDFSIYPNPFQNSISIDWKGKQQSTATVRLLNIVGQEVYNTALELNTGKNTLELPVLNSGNYILVIQGADGKSWSSKVVKK